LFNCRSENILSWKYFNRSYCHKNKQSVHLFNGFQAEHYVPLSSTDCHCCVHYIVLIPAVVSSRRLFWCIEWSNNQPTSIYVQFLNLKNNIITPQTHIIMNATFQHYIVSVIKYLPTAYKRVADCKRLIEFFGIKLNAVF